MCFPTRVLATISSCILLPPSATCTEWICRRSALAMPAATTFFTTVLRPGRQQHDNCTSGMFTLREGEGRQNQDSTMLLAPCLRLSGVCHRQRVLSTSQATHLYFWSPWGFRLASPSSFLRGYQTWPCGASTSIEAQKEATRVLVLLGLIGT